MDKRIRRNELCIVGLPRCDFVFSSTRTCFIAYGFLQSSLETSILRYLLERRGIQPEEAGGSLAPGQNAFCTKICSKIITSQFSIIILNNKIEDGREIPNANVNMEYGLMLGFNKYVIPFQRESQTLPFNVAGLDTIKYTDSNFESRATQPLEQAITETRQDVPPLISPDQLIGTFLLQKKALLNPLTNEGDKNIFFLGSPLNFNLINDFSGMNYMFLGNFTDLRPEVVLWRIKMLTDIIADRRSSLKDRGRLGLFDLAKIEFFDEFLKRIQIWIIVTRDEDKKSIQESLKKPPGPRFETQIFSLNDIRTELEKLS